MADSKRTMRIGGRTLRVSNLDKVLYPADGTTKADVIGYYRAIAAVMLPHCRERAATRKRRPIRRRLDDEPPACPPSPRPPQPCRRHRARHMQY